MQPKLFLVLTCAIILIHSVKAQETFPPTDKGINLPSSFLSAANGKITSVDNRLTKQTEKYLHNLAKSEIRLKKKLAKIDSAVAKNCFAEDPSQHYNALIRKLKSTTGKNTDGLTGAYMPYIDSLKGSLSFLNNNPDLLNNSKILP